MPTIADTLAERGARYGTFQEHAKLSVALQDAIFMHKHQNWKDYQREALVLICHKLARIANGDPDYDDSWRDIAGYAQLVVDILNGKDT